METNAPMPNGSIEKDQSDAQVVEPKDSRLLELANSIQVQVTEIQKHLTETGQPGPDFDASSPPTDFGGIYDSRDSVLENLSELQDLLLTPRELLHTQCVG